MLRQHPIAEVCPISLTSTFQANRMQGAAETVSVVHFTTRVRDLNGSKLLSRLQIKSFKLPNFTEGF